jgi:uncharacterized protein (DUF1697 family)
MTAFVALLRAVNVGGTGKLPMTELKAICEAAGFAKVKSSLEKGLADYAGKPVGVLVRTAEEMAAVLAVNPFKHTPPNRTVAIFLDEAPPADALDTVVAPDGEAVGLGAREIYVHYPQGQGTSKLKLPAARHGTARNINTVATLARMAGEL